MLIREIEGGTDSNNRKITVITICCDSWFLAHGQPLRRRCDSGASRAYILYYIGIRLSIYYNNIMYYVRRLTIYLQHCSVHRIKIIFMKTHGFGGRYTSLSRIYTYFFGDVKTKNYNNYKRRTYNILLYTRSVYNI